MKTIKFLLIAVLFVAAYSASAQSTSFYHDGTNLYYTGGKVGIGLAAPLHPLHVFNSTQSVIRASSSRATDGLTASLQLRNDVSTDMLNISLRRTSGVYEMIQSVYSSTKASWLEYCFLNINTGDYEMKSGIRNVLFSNTGTFGIGTGANAISNGSKLAVNGKISCTELVVSLTPWADYVFNDDYNLKPLSEVEAFIKTNKHLPDVPSTLEVQKTGLNLGETDAMLLRKIEELTLYMIDLKKENDLLKSKVNELSE
jgi:hypothetical protein